MGTSALQMWKTFLKQSLPTSYVDPGPIKSPLLALQSSIEGL